MNAFDKVIGYNDIKAELLQICDMLKNREKYEQFGAKFPHGIILHGKPGVGKTLMANAFIKESGLPCYTVRRKDASPYFTKEIEKAFCDARENAPAIVFLDDMDKFSNEDDRHTDAEEYVAIQACIDESAGQDVFVLATVNNIHKLPDSLIRAGRFDRELRFYSPKRSDARKIVEYYLSDKKLSEEANLDDFVKMMTYNSCSELETIINDAAIRAAYAGKDVIEMNDLAASVLTIQYNINSRLNKPGARRRRRRFEDFCDEEDDAVVENEPVSALEKRKVALHEAGHLVASEILKRGSVGLATICPNASSKGFIYKCVDTNSRSAEILISLAGKAAVELYYFDACASGCESDISSAVKLIRSGITYSGTHGFSVVQTSLGDDYDHYYSDNYKNSIEILTKTELEKYMRKAREIMMKNRAFLEKVTDALLEKEVLLASDIKSIRESVTGTPTEAAA